MIIISLATDKNHAKNTGYFKTFIIAFHPDITFNVFETPVFLIPVLLTIKHGFRMPGMLQNVHN